jgi:cobalt-precorrin 5A hydrolase
MIVAGIGCRKSCEAQEILRLVERALDQAALPVAALAALATAAFKVDAEAPRAAAEALGLPLVLIDEATLRAASARALTRSPVTLAATGLMAIAESAALAAAGEGSTLILPRLKSAAATCALARGPER